jgi:hypothetical protein
MSRKRKLAMAASIIGAGALLGMRKSPTMSGDDRRDTQKTIKNRKPKRVIDSGSKTMVGSKVKTTVDQDALPREVKEKAQKVAKTNEKIKKAVIKRRDEGDLSPTMPKRANQISSDFGLGAFDGAKKGKMIRARGGGMAIQGMKPTKLY